MSLNGTESTVVLLANAQRSVNQITNKIIVTYDSGFRIWLRESKINIHKFDTWEDFCIFLNGLRLGSNLQNFK